MHSLPVAELAWPQQVSNFRNVVSIAISEWENKLSDSKRSCHFAKLAPGQKFRLVTRRDRAGQISCDRENLFLFRQQSCSLCILIATITFWSRETPCITRTRCFEKNLPLIVFLREILHLTKQTVLHFFTTKTEIYSELPILCQFLCRS